MKYSLVFLITGVAFVVAIFSTIWAQEGGPPGSIQFLPTDIEWADNPALPPADNWPC